MANPWKLMTGAGAGCAFQSCLLISQEEDLVPRLRQQGQSEDHKHRKEGETSQRRQKFPKLL
jgi:hypothetical protein